MNRGYGGYQQGYNSDGSYGGAGGAGGSDSGQGFDADELQVDIAHESINRSIRPRLSSWLSSTNYTHMDTQELEAAMIEEELRQQGYTDEDIRNMNEFDEGDDDAPCSHHSYGGGGSHYGGSVSHSVSLSFGFMCHGGRR